MAYSAQPGLLDEGEARWPLYCCCFLLLAFVAVCLASMPGMSITADEPEYYAMGLKSLAGTLDACSMQRTPITVFNAAAAKAFGYDALRNGEMSLFVARIPTVLAAALLGFYVMLWARRLYGPAGMLLSLSLFAFCPNTIAHARLMTSDIYFSLFCFMSVYHLVRYLTDGKNTDYALLVFSLGMAILAKQSAVLLAVILPLVVWKYYAFGRGGRGRLSPLRVLVAVLGCLLILNAAYDFRFYSSPNIPFFTVPFRVHLPLPQVFLDAYYSGLRYNGRGWPAYLLGAYSSNGWWWYYPVLFVLKEPVAFLVMLFSRIFACGKDETAWEVENSLDRFAILTSMLVILLFFVLVCRVDIGIRYILPAYPFLFVFAGKLGACVASRRSFFPKAAVVMLTVWYAASSLSYYPHFLSFGSDLIVNRMELYKYFADSNLEWGQNNVLLDRYINRMRIEGRDVTINPDRPMRGLIVVDTNSLLDVSGKNHDKYEWLLSNYIPVGNIGYGLLVFDTAGTGTGKNAGKATP